MSDSPFEPPAENKPKLSSGNQFGGGNEDFSDVIFQLQRMGAWHTFFAVLGFICGGLLIFGGLLVVFASGAPSLCCILSVYVLMGFLYIRSSLYLWDSSKALKAARMEDGDVSHHIYNAVTSQYKFWRFIGILTIILLALYAAFFLLMLLGVGLGAVFAPMG